MTHVRLIRFALVLFIALSTLGIALIGSPARAQTVEAEPNSICVSAQNLGAVTLPSSVTGSLDTPPDTPDVDYYRITATPGDLIAIDERGETSGNGTLSDPFLGVFSSACSLLGYDDDSGILAGGGYRDARVEITVPADGVLLIAASGLGDWEFAGYGYYPGSYKLTVSKVTTALAIGGRIVNANTGAAVQSALVWLVTCSENGECSRYAGYTHSAADGSFRFEPGNWSLYDDTLRTGEYRLIVSSGMSFLPYEGTPFQLLEGQDLNLGNLGLQPVPVVGSIGGRLVDAITGDALPGNVAPFSRVELQSCSPVYGCWTSRYADVDAQGNFVFESFAYAPLEPGTYRIEAIADQYQSTTGPEFEVAADQHYDVGDFQVKSFPVRINLLQGCSTVPSTGGTCTYVVRVTNGNPGKLQGETWSLVRSVPWYWGGQSTEFQAGRKTVSLLPGISTDVTFSFHVPATLADNTAICAEAFTSHKTNPFDSIGSRDLFCMAKIGETFQVMPDKAKRELLKKAK